MGNIFNYYKGPFSIIFLGADMVMVVIGEGLVSEFCDFINVLNLLLGKEFNDRVLCCILG